MTAVAEKTGNQVSAAPAQLVRQVFGVNVECEIRNGVVMIKRRGALHAMQRKLDISDRQARGACSSYQVEGIGAQRGGLKDPFMPLSAFVDRVLEHADRGYESSVSNGELGGRPRKAP